MDTPWLTEQERDLFFSLLPRYGREIAENGVTGIDVPIPDTSLKVSVSLIVPTN